MSIGFDNQHTLTFPIIGTYNGSVTVNQQTVTLTNIETTIDDLQIEIDSGLTSAIEISSFIFGKNCWIGSSLRNCEYDSGGTLKINSYQPPLFKFNKINISGDSGATNNGGITINSDDHELSISGGRYYYGIENNRIITINNYGIMNINGGNYAINNSGITTINNYGTINISGANYGINNSSLSSSLTFNNFGIIDLNGYISFNGTTTIDISDSLFLVESSNTSTSIDFTSTSSTWNGRTFTNNSNFSGFTKASIVSYFDNYPSSITLQPGEQVFNKLENTFDESIYYPLQSKGTLILQPKSSLEVSDPFELPQGSTLICSKDTKINNSQIQGESSVLLKSELKDKTITNGKVIF